MGVDDRVNAAVRLHLRACLETAFLETMRACREVDCPGAQLRVEVAARAVAALTLLFAQGLVLTHGKAGGYLVADILGEIAAAQVDADPPAAGLLVRLKRSLLDSLGEFERRPAN